MRHTTLEPKPGELIEKFAKRLVSKAKRESRAVAATFSGHELLAFPSTDPAELVADFDKYLNRGE